MLNILTVDTTEKMQESSNSKVPLLETDKERVCLYGPQWWKMHGLSALFDTDMSRLTGLNGYMSELFILVKRRFVKCLAPKCSEQRFAWTSLFLGAPKICMHRKIRTRGRPCWQNKHINVNVQQYSLREHLKT